VTGQAAARTVTRPCPCGAAIFWAVTVPGGARMPVETGSRDDPDGDLLVWRLAGVTMCLVLTAAQRRPGGVADVLVKVGAGGVALMHRARSHWGQCDQRGQFTKGAAGG